MKHVTPYTDHMTDCRSFRRPLRDISAFPSLNIRSVIMGFWLVFAAPHASEVGLHADSKTRPKVIPISYHLPYSIIVRSDLGSLLIIWIGSYVRFSFRSFRLRRFPHIMGAKYAGFST